MINDITESHINHTNPYEYCECQICGFRGKEIPNHVTRHGISVDDYKKQFNAVVKSQSSCDRVKGDKNPGFQHGGKLSPFSKNFVGYSDVDNAEEIIKQTIEKKKKTVEDNPQNQPTRIEYWLAQGYSETEAIVKLGERQSTFTKAKCIEKHGEVEGLKVWQSRQDKWTTSYYDKTEEEINDINRRKSSNFNYKTAEQQGEYYDGNFYIIDTGDNTVKIGITSKPTIIQRYSVAVSKMKHQFINVGNITDAMKIERVFKYIAKSKLVDISEKYPKFGCAETFSMKYEKVLEIVEKLLENKKYEGMYLKITNGEVLENSQ